MTLFELQKHIKQKTLPKFLVFTGTEYAIIQLYITQIAKQFNLKIQNINSCSQVVQKQRVISLTGDNNLFVCRYDMDFMKKEKDWQYIHKSLGTNYLITVYSSLDKRGKFYKEFSDGQTDGVVVDFCEQPEDTVKIMLKNEIKLCDELLTRLIIGCSGNYSKCILEVNKIKTYSNIYGLTHEDAYKTLLAVGTIHEDLESKLPEFVNSVMRKDASCYSKYKILQQNGESNIVILAWLYNAMRNQLLVHTVSKPTVESTGLNYFFLKECLEREGYFTTNELRNILRVIKYCEQGIKNGLLDESMCIDYILVNIFN